MSLIQGGFTLIRMGSTVRLFAKKKEKKKKRPINPLKDKIRDFETSKTWEAKIECLEGPQTLWVSRDYRIVYVTKVSARDGPT